MSWQKDEIPLHTVFTLKTQAIKRMSTAAVPTLFVTRLTREPTRTMTQPFVLIRLAVKGSIHSPAGVVESCLKMWTSAGAEATWPRCNTKPKLQLIIYGMWPGTPSIVIKWDHTEKRKSFITQHAPQKDRVLAVELFFKFSTALTCW